MPIPFASELPGYVELQERAEAALGRCQEAQNIEFKESAEWDELCWKIVHTALGMANLRDGGVIIVGVSERDDSWELSGIDPEHLASYEPDDIIACINVYASPDVEADIVVVEFQDKRFLVIGVREFRDTPVICKKTRDGTSLRRGAIYARPSGMPRTSRVMEASELHELLGLAAEKRARRLIETVRRVGLDRFQPHQDRYDQELEDL